MAKGAARQGDKCTGHGSHHPRAAVQGSPDVFINNKPAHRKGDKWAVHGSHDSILAQGSSSVFTNGKPQGRIGDRVLCGSRVAQGSPDVFVGDDSSSSSATASTGAASQEASYSSPERFANQPGGGASESGYSGSGTSDTDAGINQNVTPDPDTNQPLDASDDDIDWLTTCMMDEALNQKTSDAWAAVAQVVCSRLQTGRDTGTVNPAWSGTIKGIVLANGQFSGFYFDMINGRYTRVVASKDWSAAETRGKQKMAKYRALSQWSQFHTVAQQVQANSYQGSASWRLVKNIPALLYCNRAISNPPWATQSAYVAQIEAHTFYKG